jgi:hypothetical protein
MIMIYLENDSYLQTNPNKKDRCKIPKKSLVWNYKTDMNNEESFHYKNAEIAGKKAFLLAGSFGRLRVAQ